MNAPDSAATLPRTSYRFGIAGMTCASCAGRVERSLAAVDGVAEATVNLATETAEVATDAPVSMQALAAAVEKAGYALASRQTSLVLGGMTCSSCVSRIERALAKVPGVIA